MRKCQFCAEEIQDEAVKCRFCGEGVQTPIRPGSSTPNLSLVAGALLVAVLLAYGGYGATERARLQYERYGAVLEKQSRENVQASLCLRETNEFLDLLYRELTRSGNGYAFVLQRPYVEHPIGSPEWRAQGEALQKSSRPAGLAVALWEANNTFRRLHGRDSNLYLEIQGKRY